MAALRALSIALVLGLGWPSPSAAPIAPPILPRAAATCAGVDSRAIAFRCATTPPDLGAASVLDAPRPGRVPPDALRFQAAALPLGATAPAVPEPAPWALLSGGLIALALRRSAR